MRRSSSNRCWLVAFRFADGAKTRGAVSEVQRYDCILSNMHSSALIQTVQKITSCRGFKPQAHFQPWYRACLASMSAVGPPSLSDVLFELCLCFMPGKKDRRRARRKHYYATARDRYKEAKEAYNDYREERRKMMRLARRLGSYYGYGQYYLS